LLRDYRLNGQDGSFQVMLTSLQPNDHWPAPTRRPSFRRVLHQRRSQSTRVQYPHLLTDWLTPKCTLLLTLLCNFGGLRPAGQACEVAPPARTGLFRDRACPDVKVIVDRPCIDRGAKGTYRPSQAASRYGTTPGKLKGEVLCRQSSVRSALAVIHWIR
jgi:hypothetical protein